MRLLESNKIIVLKNNLVNEREDQDIVEKIYSRGNHE